MIGGLPYNLFAPRSWNVPLIVSAPHSGGELTFSPPNEAIRAAMEGLNDRLVAELALPAAASLGFPVLSSRYGRAYIDLNRAEEDLDPLLIDGVMRQTEPNSLISAGLGLIPRLGSGQQPIYSQKLSLSAVQSRIVRAYRPYHRALQGLIDSCLAEFGICLLIDLHSMPLTLPAVARRALAATPGQPRLAMRAYEGTPLMLVLGDDGGRALPLALAQQCLSFFQARGMTIAHNRPYSGGHITQFYGRQVPTMQLEICRSLYVGTQASPHAKDLERLFLDFCRQVIPMAELREAAE